MTKASALPAVHPGRETTSWTSAARSGVRCAASAWPLSFQGVGAQGTLERVSVRDEML